MTGPPGLERNGGIWRRLKSGLSRASDRPRVMVQAIHFEQYQLSKKSWREWFGEDGSGIRLKQEIAGLLGPHRDVFVDSGGFQLLHRDKIDLSRWGLELTQEAIYRLQTKYGAQRIASLDAPLHPLMPLEEVRRSSETSLANIEWLVAHADQHDSAPTPYLVAHGRTAEELRSYLSSLEERVPKRWLRSSRFGIALGSQVPLAGDPTQVLSNAAEVLRWMDRSVDIDVPLHIFGIGDSLAGQAARDSGGRRVLSYDNSTYVQKAFRLQWFDLQKGAYRAFDPQGQLVCDCYGCTYLSSLGRTLVTDLLAAPAYTPAWDRGQKVTRSDLLASIAIHNLDTWRARSTIPPRVRIRKRLALNPASTSVPEYEFPLTGFEREGNDLLLLACSRHRPYRTSPSHRRVLNCLKRAGRLEKEHFDRVTLSGLHGPVHWDDEDKPAIMSYDFRVGNAISVNHAGGLRYRTGTVVKSLKRKYNRVVAFIRPGSYHRVFEPILTAHEVKVVTELPLLSRAFVD